MSESEGSSSGGSSPAMEVVDGEERGDHGIIFKKVGSELCVVKGGFSTTIPSQALAISNKFGLTFFVHSEGFCLAKTSDLVQASQALGPSAAAYSAKDNAIADIHLPSTHLIALSEDELVLAACTDKEVNFYNVPALVNKRRERFENGTALLKSLSMLGEECGIKMLAWNPRQRGVILLLTKERKLKQGPFSKQQLKIVAEDVDAVDWSPDGEHFCYATSDRNLHILHADMSSESSCMLPPEVFRETNDGGPEAHVDTLKWARSESILLSCITDSVEDEEVNSWIVVLSSNSGPIAEDLENATCVFFKGIFPSIDGSILPDVKGSLTLSYFIQPWELLIATNRKCFDDHISLLEWYDEVGQSKVYRCELVDDRFTPRIELQASGDDNCVLGLSVDRTTRSIEIPAPNCDSGEKLKAGPTLFCMTMEGNLALFSMARMDDKYKNGDILSNISELPEANEVLVSYSLGSKVADNSVSALQGPERNVKSTAEIIAEKTRTSFAVDGGKASKNVSLQGKGVSKTANANSQQLTKLPITMMGGANVHNEDSLNEAKRLEAQPKYTYMQSQRQFGAPIDDANKPASSGYSKTSSTSTISEVESEFVRELNKVKGMAVKIENLMDFIEGKRRLTKGESEPSFTKTSVEEIELKTQNIYKQCKHFHEQLLEQKQSIVDVQDDCLQVDACRVYVQSILEQAFDTRYKELWSKQTLHPELAAMRKRLLQADQCLKQEIAELDEHLHNLELYQSQRKRQPWTAPALAKSKNFRRIQSLYDTVNMQMVVAQQLAHRLALQAEALKLPLAAKDQMESGMDTSISRLQKMTLHDPAVKTTNQSSPSRPEFSPIQVKSLIETPSKQISQSGLRAGLQDSTRRRRDSVDKLWFDAATAKTTVKRVDPSTRFNVLSSPSTQSVFQAPSALQENEPLHVGAITRVTNMSPFIPIQTAEEGPQHARMKGKEPTLPVQRSAQDHMKPGGLDTDTSPSLKQKRQQWPTSLASSNPSFWLSTMPPEDQVSVGSRAMSQRSTGQESQAVFSSKQVLDMSPSSIGSTAVQFTGQSKSSSHDVGTTGNKDIDKQSQLKMAQVTTSSHEKDPYFSSQVLINDSDKKQESLTLQGMGKLHQRALVHSTATEPHDKSDVKANVDVVAAEFGKSGNEGQRNKLAAAVANMDVKPTSGTYRGNVAGSSASPDEGQETGSSLQRESMYKPKSLRESSFVWDSTNPLHPATTQHTHRPLHSSSAENPSSSSLSMTPSTLPTFSSVQEASSASTRPSLAITSEAVTFPQKSALHDMSISSIKPSNFLDTSIQGEKSLFPSTTTPSQSFIPQAVQGTPIFVEEEDMEEEDNTEIGSSSFAGFGLGSSSPSTTRHVGPFGLGLSLSSAASKPSSPFGAPSPWSQSGLSSLSEPSGQLFKPASFSIPTPQSTAPSASFGNSLTSESASAFNLHGGFGSSAQPNVMFGMPTQPGSSGQQALNNALGSFGQTRQIGASFGSSPRPSGFGFGSGNFAAPASSGGFASAATSGGFAGVSSTGGFAGVAAGGGFASAATGSGFAGFSGAGIGGSMSSNVNAGGFAAFSGGAFSAFGGNTNSSIFTQMRK